LNECEAVLSREGDKTGINRYVAVIVIIILLAIIIAAAISVYP